MVQFVIGGILGAATVGYLLKKRRKDVEELLSELKEFEEFINTLNQEETK